MRYRKLLALGLVSLSFGFAPHQGREPVRWALIVGAGDYANYGPDEAGGDLPGARHDAENVYEVLTGRWGFDSANVRLLIDADATRNGIETSLREWLPSVVQPGDMVLFYYSGHGSQTWDQDGDEPDGLDETICPTDVLRKSSRRDIKDDELRSWLDGLPTRNITVILDSCHSGTGTRAVAPFVRTRSLNRDVHEDLAEEQPATATRSVTGAAGAGAANDDVLDSFGGGVLEIASAQSDQYAIESVFDGIDGRLPRPGGAFTTPLVHHLWKVPLSTTYEEIFRMTVQTMKQRNFEQNPRLGEVAGRKDQPVFALPGDRELAAAPDPEVGLAAAAPPARPQASVQAGQQAQAAADAPAAAASAQPAAAPERLPEGALPVLADRGQAVELGGGLAAGVTVGSVYRLDDRLLVVTEVAESRATAEASRAATRGIQAVERSVVEGPAALLVAYRHPDARLRVTVAELPAAVVQGLRAQLATTPGVVLQEDPRTVSDLLIRPAAGGVEVLGVDGGLRHSVGADGVVDATAAILRKELRALQVAALENPANPFPVELAFGGEENRYAIGDEITFRLRAGRDGYLTIVDVDPAGAVTVVFPNQWDANNRVRAGTEVVIPTATMGFQFRAAEPAGRGLVRVFVTERPLSLPAEGEPSAEQLASALREAAGPAPFPGSTAVPVDSWATTSVVYEIQR